MSGDNAESARKGLLHSAVGKAKEVAGAVLNNDSLVKEGQLRQAEAGAEKQASTTDALADARSEQAVDELGQAHEQARDERRAAAQRAGAQEQAAERDRQQEHAEAEERAEARRRAAETVVQERTTSEVADAVAETRSEVREADQEEAQALERQRQAEQRADAEEQAARRERATAAELDPATEGERAR